MRCGMVVTLARHQLPETMERRQVSGIDLKNLSIAADIVATA
jgi:hypothetical protein